jgi:hypothetical protein
MVWLSINQILSVNCGSAVLRFCGSAVLRFCGSAVLRLPKQESPPEYSGGLATLTINISEFYNSNAINMFLP